MAGDETGASFQLDEQHPTTSVTYLGYSDGPPFTVAGDRVVLPSVQLVHPGRPPVTLESGAFTFPTVPFITGQRTTVRRELRPNSNPTANVRYVFEDDGTYRIESYALASGGTITVHQSSWWEVEGPAIRLLRGGEPGGREEVLPYVLADGRLALRTSQQGCGSGRSCLDLATWSLGLPPGSLDAFHSDDMSTFRQ